MNIYNEVLFFFSALGSFNGLILSLYFLMLKKDRKASHFLLGLLILAFSIRTGKSVLLFFQPDIAKIYLQIGLSACYFIGPALYFYFKSVFNKETFKFSTAKIHLLFHLLIILTIGILYPYQFRPEAWNPIIVQGIYIQWAFYLIGSIYVSRHCIKKFFDKEYVMTNLDKWMLTLLAGVTIIFIAYSLAMHGTSRPLYIFAPIAFSAVVYYMMFVLYYKKMGEEIFFAASPKYSNKKIEGSEVEMLSMKVRGLMTEDKLFKNPQLKIADLAGRLDISVHYLSQLLNDNIGKSFSTLINEYRVDEAKNLIDAFDHYTLEAIGYEVGFSSKSNFFATFKKLTNTTPAAFKKTKSQLASK